MLIINTLPFQYRQSGNTFANGSIEGGITPCIHVGKHRRIEFSDLLAYEKVRDQSRREALDRLSKLLAGLGKSP
jgi:hypothetical protein